ncbi:HAD family hydrolase [Pedobacter sp. BMA]|uniref:HAD family hydrolase n=1 Tax=Pedobacter sp. BMA TaxID=1663685 RepID=UPI00069E2525|nr:NIF family HAD-type phosphatase [Pedobacter sp. BMA]
MKKAVIFDLDQTLIDTSSIEHLRRAGSWQFAYEGVKKLNSYAGIDEFIHLLNQNSVDVFIITMSPSTYCSKVIERCKWEISGTVCYHDVRPLIKPHPEPFLKLIRDFKLDTQSLISAGDSAHDIVSSNKANVTSIACSWGSRDTSNLLSASPTYVANSPSVMFDLIKTFHGICE